MTSMFNTNIEILRLNVVDLREVEEFFGAGPGVAQLPVLDGVLVDAELTRDTGAHQEALVVKALMQLAAESEQE